MERVNQYFKDKIKSLDDYYPFIRNDCKKYDVYNSIELFLSIHNNTRRYKNEITILTNEKEMMIIS